MSEVRPMDAVAEDNDEDCQGRENAILKVREVRRQGDYCFPKTQAGDDRAKAAITRIGHNFTRILPQRGTISKAS